MNIINKKIEELKLYDKKIRNNSDAVGYVTESIKKYGWKQPIVIDTNNVIVAGNTRYLAAKELGYDEVPCVVADELTEDEIKRYRIADNKTAEMSRWDYLGLAKEIDTISGEDLFDFGFTEREIGLLKGLNSELEAPIESMKAGRSEDRSGGVYRPNYKPSISREFVTDDDIRKAEFEEETRFVPRPVDKIKVYVCPTCGKRFEVRG